MNNIKNMTLEQTIASPAFKSIFPVLDDMIGKKLHPNIEIRKMYSAMRIMGFSPEETVSSINEMLVKINKQNEHKIKRGSR